MERHLRCVGLVCVLSLCVACGLAEPMVALQGTVTDSEGAAVGRAYVRIHWDASGATVGLIDNVGIKHDLVLLTDERGRFIINIPPGFYDLFVSAEGFSPECRKVRLRTTLTGSYKISLRADPLIIKELGDYIPK